ncbi:hypothetical protein BDV95DRAFT_543035 [Massariosphaeria phaeospora]|uniref:Uncharacterized protein n=1 Tax=Massariosphaeria phaeospora TaxID=100035 RepID=A0A7C8M9X9_9PLEO|nr:hypothetical protein BDV95DRAFT_543035 [Massariosphaeria phaeospora]
MGLFTKAQPAELKALDVVFSCSFCYANFAEIYNGRDDTVHGLSDGINPKERIVTKLYLLKDCNHVICSKHLEGGAPPFHAAGTRPHLPCPVCQAKGDSQPRALYSIRGFRKGEHDAAIPSSWFAVPPMRQENAENDMEALRFHYISLVNCAVHSTNALTDTRKRLTETENELKRVQNVASEEHMKVMALEEENGRLRAMLPELQKYEALKGRMPAIQHYLKLIPTIAEQNDRMRERLASLGFQMALEPLAYHKQQFPIDENGEFIGDMPDASGEALQRTGSSHTMGRSGHASAEYAPSSSSPQMARPLKRQRMDSPLTGHNIHAAPPSSRDLMPPPAKPPSRMRSFRKLIPSIRKKISSGRASPAPNLGRSYGDADVQMEGNTYWERAGPAAQSSSDYDQHVTRGGYREETPYMSGALPNNQSPGVIGSPHLNLAPSASAHQGQGDFTFRSRSPIKFDAAEPNKLPVERSYIRLMDGLSHDNGLQLGLQDPRQSSPHQHPSLEQTRITELPKSPSPEQDTDVSKRWDLGHAFLHQSPNGPSATAYRHPDPLRSNPPSDHHSSPFRELTTNPVTPAAPRTQPAPRPAESVYHSLRRLSISKADADGNQDRLA